MFKKSALTRKSLLSLVFGFLVVSVFLLTFSVNVMAASDQTYYPMQQNENNTISDNVVNYFKNRYSINDDNYYWFCFGPHSNGAGTNKVFYFLYWDKESSGTISAYPNSSNSSYQFKLYKNGSFNTFGNALATFTTNGDFVNSNYQYSSTGLIQSGYVYTSSVYNHSISYRSNFDLVDRYNSSTIYLLYFVPVLVPDPDDPTAPNMSSLDLDSSLNTTTVPTPPTYSNSFNEILPSYDSTAPFDSLFNIVSWGFRRAYSLLDSFIEYFKSWLGYFISIFTYLIQKIIDAIKFFVNWIYSQFLNWLTPYLKIIGFIAKILFNEDDQISIFDLLEEFKNNVSTSLSNLFSNSWFSTYWSTFETKINDAFNYFSKIVLFFTTLIVLGTDPTTHEFSIPYLTQVLLVPSTTNVIDLLIQHDEFSVIPFIQALSIKGQYIFNTLSSVTPSHTLHVPSCYFHGVEIGNFDIDFSWFDSYKVYYDAILNGFLITGYIIWLFVTFKDHLRGHFATESSTVQDNYAAGWHYDL